MIIRGLGVRGLTGLRELRVEGLDRVVRVGGPPRARQALFEALDLALSALDGPALPLRGVPASADEHGQVEIGLPPAVRARVGDDRTLKVRLDIELDPPLFGRLRELAVRDPEIVDHLGANVSLVLGWVFTADFELCTPSVLSFRIGDFVVDAERPWRAEFLAALNGRGAGPRTGFVHRIAQASTSPDPALRARHAALVRALSAAPFGLPELHVVRSGEHTYLALGPELAPLPAHGASSEAAVVLAERVFCGADVLLLDRPTAAMERPRAVRHWLEKQATADGSALEQVFLFGEPGPSLLAQAPAPEEEQPVPVLER